MMNCEEALLALSAELDGALTPEERAALEDHLRACPRCRALREELAGLHAACGHLDAQPPAELMSGVLSRLPAQDAPRGKVVVLRWRRWAAMAAVFAVVAVAAWQVPRLLKETPPQSADLAAGYAQAPMAAGDAVEPRCAEVSGETGGAGASGVTTQGAAAEADGQDDAPAFVDSAEVNVNAAILPTETPNASSKYVAYDASPAPAPEPSAAPEVSAQESVTASVTDIAGDSGASTDEAPVVRLFSARSSIPTDLGSFAPEPTGETPETPAVPAAGGGPAAESLLPLTEAPDALTEPYRAILTVPSAPASLFDAFPHWTAADGSLCCRLDVIEFRDLVSALEQDGALTYTLQEDGPGVSLNTPYCLVVVQDPTGT